MVQNITEKFNPLYCVYQRHRRQTTDGFEITEGERNVVQRYV